MPRLLMLCLTLSSCSVFTKAPDAVTVDVNWEFEDQGPGLEPKACLQMTDVEKLRETLIRCGAAK